MKKKILVFGLIIFALSGCSYNKQIVDLNYGFTKVDLIRGDNVVTYEIKKWNDFDDSDMVQFVTKNGEVIYTHGENVIFYGN